MQRISLLTLFLSCLPMLAGCGSSQAGSQADAQAHFEREFQKWIAGEDNDVRTIEYRFGMNPPISYDIRSITKERPDFLAIESASDLPEDWEEWPAYKFNVVIEWESEAGSPTETVTTYRFTWNTQERKWYVNERF